MVSNQKTIKNQGKNSQLTKNDATKGIEKRINTVLNACQDIIKCNNTFMSKQNVNKKKTTAPVKAPKNNASEITLEKVAQDMSNILKDLKDHLPTFKSKNDSFSDVVPKLEESFLKSNQNTANKTPFFKNCRAKSSTSRPMSAGNNNNFKNKPKPVPTPNNTRPKSEGNNNKTGKNSANDSANNKNVTGVKTNTSSRQSNISNFNKRIVPRIEYNPLGVLKAEVQLAIKERKTFTVKGTFPAVRRALLNRGWIEKLHISYRDRANEDLRKFQTYSIPQLVELLRNKDTVETCRKLIKSKLLANHQVDLYWSYNYDSFKECSDKVKLTKINKFRRDWFSYTSKLGLCNASKKAVWFKIPGVATLNHPRTYSLTKNGDTPGFIKDFNKTAAMSLLKWVVQNNTTGEYKVLSPSGKIPIEVFDFAINECYKFIKKAQHEDIDNEIKDALDYEWTEFLEYFYKTVHIGNHFKKNSDVTETDMVRKANFILKKLNMYFPYLDMDGIMNIWILKPTDGSQGVGIHMCRTLQYILKTIKANPNRRYIIQKYIERPLLIHNTKFDIRQWFLISSTVPLMIWMYKQCYLRFSSQTYNLRKLHESIHLTNNSVQSRYRQTNRDIALPSYDMWDSAQFRNYLSDKGYPNAFDTVIYPGMKQCIIAAVIMYQDKIDRRKNCFELYGADFMLTEDFKPWLIEINSNPALHASTPVTARMCPIVLEDVIKVVVDYEANKSASTGGFELVYQKDLPTNIKSADLQVQGIPVTNDYFCTPPLKEGKPFDVTETTTPSFLNTQGSDAIDYVKYIGKGMRKTLEDLLEILKKEKQKRHERKNKSVVTILSNIVTETKESQTEHTDPSRIISEILIKSQILEVDEPTMCLRRTRKKGESEQDPINSQVRQKKSNMNRKLQQIKRKTIIQSKTDDSEVESRKGTETMECAHIKIKSKEGMGMQSVNQSNIYVTENSQENVIEAITFLQSRSDKDESLQENGKNSIMAIEPQENEIIQTKSDVTETIQSRKESQIIIPSNVVVNRKQENETQRKSSLQCKSYTYGRCQENEREPKIIFQCRSDITGKIQENGEGSKLIIQSKSYINENQINRRETKTMIQSKTNINGSAPDGKETRIPSGSKHNEPEKKNHENTSIVKTSVHNSNLYSSPDLSDQVRQNESNLNVSSTFSDALKPNCETGEETQNNSVSGSTSKQINKNNKKKNVKKNSAASKTEKHDTTELNDVTKKTLLNFFKRAKKNATNKQQ